MSCCPVARGYLENVELKLSFHGPEAAKGKAIVSFVHVNDVIMASLRISYEVEGRMKGEYKLINIMHIDQQ
jgi:hypothetical protein